MVATWGAGGRGCGDTNHEDEDARGLDATASDVELADLKGVETTRRGDRAVMSSSDSQILRKGVAVAMERLGVSVEDRGCVWDIMDYLCDRGLKEMDDVVEFVCQHVHTMTDGERKQYIRGLEGYG